MSDQRENILVQACALFLKDGLEGFSMRKLAKAVGVTAPALYRHFESKEQLLFDVLGEAYRRMSQRLYQALEGSTPWERLRLAGEGYVLFALEHPNVLAVHDRDGVPTLHLRMLNERNTSILDVNLHVGVLIDESDGDHNFRRLVDLKLARSRVPVFSMAFTVMHVLDADSVLHEIQQDPDRMMFLIVTMRGIDDRTLQPIFARAMFYPDQLVFGKGFDDMIDMADDGVMEVQVDRLDQLVDRRLSGG